jgi:hypothetical protein
LDEGSKWAFSRSIRNETVSKNGVFPLRIQHRLRLAQKKCEEGERGGAYVKLVARLDMGGGGVGV